MQTFLFGYGAGALSALLVGVIWAALVIARRADDINLTFEPAPDPVPEPVEGVEGVEADLRHRLAICQHAAEQQRQRADNYYDLFCEGARANAQLRHNGGNHAA